MIRNKRREREDTTKERRNKGEGERITHTHTHFAAIDVPAMDSLPFSIRHAQYPGRWSGSCAVETEIEGRARTGSKQGTEGKGREEERMGENVDKCKGRRSADTAEGVNRITARQENNILHQYLCYGMLEFV